MQTVNNSSIKVLSIIYDCMLWVRTFAQFLISMWSGVRCQCLGLFLRAGMNMTSVMEF